MTLSPAYEAPLARCQPLQSEGMGSIHQIDGHAHEPEGGESHGRCHPAHLAVASLPQLDLEPRCRDRASLPDRWLPFPQHGIQNDSGASRQGSPSLDVQSPAQIVQAGLAGFPLHLDPVGAPMAPAGVGESVLQPTIAGEQQQAFAVGIEATRRVHLPLLDPVGQAAPSTAGLTAELAEHAVRLVEQEGGWRSARSLILQLPLRERHRFTTPMEMSSRPRSMEIGGRVIGWPVGCGGGSRP